MGRNKTKPISINLPSAINQRLNEYLENNPSATRHGFILKAIGQALNQGQNLKEEKLKAEIEALQQELRIMTASAKFFQAQYDRLKTQDHITIDVTPNL